MTPNQKAFLDMLGWSEGTDNEKQKTNNHGYDVLVGGGLFFDYADHPRKLVKLSATLSSTAAGRYQLLARYFDAYKKQLALKDFSATSQDTIALQQIRERHAINDIEDGNIPAAIAKCARIWASLPGNDYGQHQQKLADLEAAYVKAGGKLNGQA